MVSRKLRTTWRDHDLAIAIVFGLLSVIFVVTAFSVPAFMEWIFARHENVLSWVIRPLFLIPYCLFAFHRSLAGIAATLFLLLTSMFWFPQPDGTHELVREFLEFEKDYLMGGWNAAKIAGAVLVPLTMGMLAYAFWRRSLWLGFSTIAAIAVLKSLWSVFFGGESGITVIAPALIGLLACFAFIHLGLRHAQKQQRPATRGGSPGQGRTGN